MPLADLFIATDEDARSGVVPGQDSSQNSRDPGSALERNPLIQLVRFATAVGTENANVIQRKPSPETNRIDVEGFDMIPLAVLLCLLTGEKWSRAIEREFSFVHEGSKDGPWIHSVPPRLVELLSELTPEQQKKMAVAWSKTEELEDLEERRSGITEETLGSIVLLARRAKAAGKGIFLWTAL
jgi:hypothetical protein